MRKIYNHDLDKLEHFDYILQPKLPSLELISSYGIVHTLHVALRGGGGRGVGVLDETLITKEFVKKALFKG